MVSVSTFWRWGQLALALLIMAIEYVCRGVLGTVFNFLPIRMLCSVGLLPSQLSSSQGAISEEETEEEKDLERGTTEMIRARGYPCEEHFTVTEDGFVLGMQRIPHERYTQDGASEEPLQRDPDEGPRPAVLILHGFMQCSEAWVCRKDPANSLPLVLADAGYDVWLGNNRGNKYSYKHMKHAPTDEKFWDWSLDELACYDVPAMIDHILQRNGGAGLTLIGFSQGTAQSWAALSSSPRVASKVRLFIALAPVATVHGFSNPLIDSVARTRPDFISLLFGKRAFLPITVFWRNVLPRDRLVALLDYAVNFLFGWNCKCLDPAEKKLLYSHIYSFASVKAVVHWFQIIQSGRFQMFDESLLVRGPSNVSYVPSAQSLSVKAREHRSHSARRDSTTMTKNGYYASHVVPSYDPGQIVCPVALYYGGRDTLPNTPELLASLPSHLVLDAHCVPEYEHLDFMWACDVGSTIYSRILTVMGDSRKKGII
eukprot:TRINITY_DN7101_c0_g1_i1.p1 TRINITY_DN7101_c0_g1~~TRINITY_DN7101_c0_g1_i1.p1  ORF type:complete len:484 (-),score=119.34 TRINITY_DN7101_c0_g1_i1:81-1532(-)